jgi:hypothetical protein
LLGKPNHAAAKIKEAASHYSAADTMLRARYGQEALPNIGGKTAGEHASDVANDYNTIHHTAKVKQSELDISAHSMHKYLLRTHFGLPFEDIDLKAEAKRAAEPAPVVNEVQVEKEKQTPIELVRERRSTPELEATLNTQLDRRRKARVSTRLSELASAGTAPPFTAELSGNTSSPFSKLDAPTVKAPTGKKPSSSADKFVEPATNRYLGKLAVFGKSGTPVVKTENAGLYSSMAEQAIRHLRAGERIPNEIKMSLGTSGMEAINKVAGQRGGRGGSMAAFRGED